MDDPANRDVPPLRRLLKALPRARRRDGVLLVGLTLISALLDIVSIGAIVPFLALIVGEGGGGGGVLDRLATALPSGNPGILAAAVLFVAMAVLAGIARLALVRTSARLSFQLAHDLNLASFAWLMRQDYSYFLDSHSGDILARFEKISDVTFSIVMSLVDAVSQSIIGLAILAFVILIAPVGVVLVAIGLMGLYLLAAFALRARLHRNSETASSAFSRLIRIVQHALGSIRDIILDRSASAVARDFERTSDEARRAFTSSAVMAQAPRILIEALAITAFAILAWQMASAPGGLVAAIPMLGALAMAAQRLLPIAQAAFRAWSGLASSRAQLADVVSMIGPVELLDEVALTTLLRPPLVRFRQVDFAYHTGRKVLSGIDLDIAPAERIGIAGPSGAGKSSLVDLLLGLLEPTQGKISIDGVLLDRTTRERWQAHVAHVPQEIYLIDATIADNIAFARDPATRDDRRVHEAAIRAGLEPFLASLPDGLQTITGERGVRLSGGQRQRIAIARALYKQAAMMVLDEATSALDEESEAAILDTVFALNNVTLVLVSHRASVLDRCDRIVRLETGRIVAADRAALPVSARC